MMFDIMQTQQTLKDIFCPVRHWINRKICMRTLRVFWLFWISSVASESGKTRSLQAFRGRKGSNLRTCSHALDYSSSHFSACGADSFHDYFRHNLVLLTWFLTEQTEPDRTRRNQTDTEEDKLVCRMTNEEPTSHVNLINEFRLEPTDWNNCDWIKAEYKKNI